MGQTYQEDFIKVNGVRLRILISEPGDFPWLILWPGMGGTAEEFLALHMSATDNGANVVSIDPPGHGQSEVWPVQLTKKSVCDIWRHVLAHVMAESAFIGGHSYGAYTAVWTAEFLQEKVKGVILLDGGYMEPYWGENLHDIAEQNKAFLESRIFESWEAFFAEEKGAALSWDKTIEEMLRSTMKIENGSIIPRISLNTANQVSELLADYRLKDLEKVEVPILLLHATLPEEFNPERLKWINKARQSMNITIQSIAESGHDLLVDQPGDVTHALWKFVKGQREGCL